MEVHTNSLGLPETAHFHDGKLFLLDQTKLPVETTLVCADTVEEVYRCIKTLTVRGAPAIGIAAAYGLLVQWDELESKTVAEIHNSLQQRADYLNESRPTAVNLKWALDRMMRLADRLLETASDAEAFRAGLVQEAVEIHEEDRKLCKSIGENGLPLIKDGQGVLTHCNAGSLATAEFGTATSPMYAAHQAGVSFKVFVDETRPLLQGSRLTAWELSHAGIDATLIADNMAAAMMAAGKVNLVIVGADRIAANGDFANKIGTLGVAILAKHFGIPFYVAAPYSTLDFETASGADIPIEYRDPDEIRAFGERLTAPKDMPVSNPAFDVTPAHLVTGFITEKGQFGAEELSKAQVQTVE